MASNDPLKVFSKHESAAGQLQAAIALIKEKQLHRALSEEPFARGLQRLVDTVRDPDRSHDRLIALAALSRLGAVAKSLQPTLERELGVALASALPPLEAIEDPDDRYYGARLWRYARASWMTQFLADAAAAEDSGENARLEALTGLIHLTGTLALALEHLREPVRKLRFETQKPGDSLGRRLRKVLQQLSKGAQELKADPGTQPGTTFAALLGDAFKPTTPLPESNEVRTALADEAAALVDGIVRARFSLATEPDTYAALEVVRGWFRPNEWNSYAEESAASRQVAWDIREGLSIIVRAGITDSNLFRCLVVAAGSEDRARQLAAGLSTSLSGLTEDVQRWLTGKNVRRHSSLANESQELAADEILGELLLDLRSLSAQAGPLQEDLLPEIQVIAPRLANPLARALGTAVSAAGKMELLAARRALRCRGEVGSVVEYSPLEHEMVGGFRPGARYVRLLSPIVESIARPDLPRVIRKALVEPTDSDNQQPA
jgi:hypothetical protein